MWSDAQRRSDQRGSTLAVALGGAIGAGLRYELGLHWGPRDASVFPWTTLAVNVVGAFLLGMLAMLLAERWTTSRYLRPFVGIGILGGFTTFSTFALESVRLVEVGRAGGALGYVAVSLVMGLTAAMVGAWLGDALGGNGVEPFWRERR